MGERSERWIVALVLAAAGLVLAAPILGRLGAPRLADLAMAAAAGSGLGAFGVAAAATLAAARRKDDRRRIHEEER